MKGNLKKNKTISHVLIGLISKYSHHKEQIQWYKEKLINDVSDFKDLRIYWRVKITTNIWFVFQLGIISFFPFL